MSVMKWNDYSRSVDRSFDIITINISFWRLKIETDYWLVSSKIWSNWNWKICNGLKSWDNKNFQVPTILLSSLVRSTL